MLFSSTILGADSLCRYNLGQLMKRGIASCQYRFSGRCSSAQSVPDFPGEAAGLVKVSVETKPGRIGWSRRPIN